MIPIFSPQPQYDQIKDLLNAALLEVAASGQYILGPQVSEFESAFAKAVGTDFAIGVNSGTDALVLALRALDIGPGDEVITTPFSYVATSEAIVRVGAKPVFADIEPASFNLNPAAVAAAITDRTKAIIPVHLFGLAADMAALMDLAKQHNLYVIEDCAQAMGAAWDGQPVGSIGHIGCFSFFPTKNLGALGDAGAITTDDESLAQRLKSLRVHGSTPNNRYDHQESGINSRLDTLQAAALLVKLPYLQGWNDTRQHLAQAYTQAIQSGPLAQYLIPPSIPDGRASHVFHQYTVKLRNVTGQQRDALQQKLLNQGVMAMIYYPIPLHLQKTHANLDYQPGSLPVAEDCAHAVLSLPMYPGLTQSDQDTVLSILQHCFETALTHA